MGCMTRSICGLDIRQATGFNAGMPALNLRLRDEVQCVSGGYDFAKGMLLQAMELIAVGQKGVDVSPEAHASWMASGRLGPPTLMGVQELMAKLQIRVDPPAEEASTNPFGTSGASGSEPSSSGARLRGGLTSCMLLQIAWGHV